jgi:hypothetical protein
MTRPKIRTFIAILAAAVAVAAVLAPVASAGPVPKTGPGSTLVTTTTTDGTIARVNDGRYRTSLEAKKIKAANCANMEILWQAAKEDADFYRLMSDISRENGYPDASFAYTSLMLEAIDRMGRVLDDMRAMGC